MKRLLLLLAFLWSCPALASNNTVVGSCNTDGPRTSFNSIAIVCSYTQDDNNNNSAVLEFKATSASSWFTAAPPIIDRRPSLVGSTNMSTDSPNQHYKEARVILTSLAQNTSYDYRLTWSDPDSVTGTNPVVVTGTVTWATNPTLGGNPRTASTDLDLQALANGGGIGAAQPGDTVTVAVGSYNPLTITNGGSSGGGSVKYVCAVRYGCSISGVGNIAISIQAGFTIVEGFDNPSSDGTSISISNSLSNVYVQYNNLDAVSTHCADAPFPGAHYSDGGVSLGTSDTHVYVGHNNITASTQLGSGACTCSAMNPCTSGNQIFNSPAAGVQMSNNDADIVICDNNVIGGFRDAITQDSSPVSGENEIECNNYVEGYKDDGIENKSSGPNNQAYGNIILVDVSGFGETCIAFTYEATTKPYGPNWIYRNTCRVTVDIANGVGGTAYKNAYSPAVYYNNSVWMDSLTSTNWDCFINGSGNGSSYYVIAKNNICTTRNGHFTTIGTTTEDGIENHEDWDYDLGYIKIGNTWAKSWGGSTYTCCGGATTFPSMALQETHGIGQSVSPGFTNTGTGSAVLMINASSNAYRAGVTINNFTTCETLWPAGTGQVDIGAYQNTATNCSQLAFTGTVGPNLHTGGTFSSFTVTAQVNGSTDTSFSGTITVALSSACGTTLGGTLTATAFMGVGTFNAVTGTGAGYPCTMTATATSYNSATSNTFSVGPNAVGFTSQPAASYNSGDTVASISGAMQFGDGTTDTSSSASVTVSITNCTATIVSGTTTKNASSGTFSFTSLVISGSGVGCTFHFASNGLTSANSNPFTLVAAVQSGGSSVSGHGGRPRIRHRGR